MARPAARPWKSQEERKQQLARVVLQGGTTNIKSFSDAAFREFVRRERDTRAAVRRKRAQICPYSKRRRASAMLFGVPHSTRERMRLSSLGLFDLARYFLQLVKVSVRCADVENLRMEFQGNWHERRFLGQVRTVAKRIVLIYGKCPFLEGDIREFRVTNLAEDKAWSACGSTAIAAKRLLCKKVTLSATRELARQCNLADAIEQIDQEESYAKIRYRFPAPPTSRPRKTRRPLSALERRGKILEDAIAASVGLVPEPLVARKQIDQFLRLLRTLEYRKNPRPITHWPPRRMTKLRRLGYWAHAYAYVARHPEATSSDLSRVLGCDRRLLRNSRVRELLDMMREEARQKRAADSKLFPADSRSLFRD